MAFPTSGRTQGAPTVRVQALMKTIGLLRLRRFPDAPAAADECAFPTTFDHLCLRSTYHDSASPAHLEAVAALTAATAA